MEGRSLRGPTMASVGLPLVVASFNFYPTVNNFGSP